MGTCAGSPYLHLVYGPWQRVRMLFALVMGIFRTTDGGHRDVRTRAALITISDGLMQGAVDRRGVIFRDEVTYFKLMSSEILAEDIHATF